MPSTATTRNRLEKQGTGENLNSWGAKLNASGLDLIDAALDGVESFTLSGSKTLSSTNYASDEARNRVLDITGGTGGTVTIPAVEKFYVIRNAATGTVVFTAGGTETFAVSTGQVSFCFCDGTEVYGMDATAEAAAAVAARIAAELAQTGAETAEATAQAWALAASNYADAGSQSADDALTAQLAAEAAQAAAEAALLPDPTGHSGQVLFTDGVDPYWADGSSWRQIGAEITTTGTGPWDFTGIDAIASGYKMFLLKFEALGCSSTFTPNLRLQGAGALKTTSGLSATSTSTASGAVLITGAEGVKGLLHGYNTTSTSEAAVISSGGAFSGSWRVTGGISRIGIQSASGTSTPTTMSIKLYGAK